MKERPIPLSGTEVRAILEGHKTQKRWVIKNAPNNKEAYLLGCHKGTWGIHEDVLKAGGVHRFKCPYGVPGDRLWVRETFCQKFENGYAVYNTEGNLDNTCCWYRADGIDVRCDDGDGGTKWNKDGSMASPWRPSIHMPRWASRLSLEITGIRIERLKSISEQDAKAEGVEEMCVLPGDQGSFVQPYAALWESINGPESWNANPWVWVVEFKQIEVAK